MMWITMETFQVYQDKLYGFKPFFTVVKCIINTFTIV